MNQTLETLKNLSDPKLARGLVEAIKDICTSSLQDRDVSIMEVCGTHTVSIARAGIRSVLPNNVKLISGPGCPVCVTDNCDIDAVIALAKLDNVIITTFGDMTRVPGSTSSLLKEQSKGADLRICYSPLDALKIAQENKDKEVVFVGVGFETTTPLVAMTVLRAQKLGLANFSVFVAHKNMPGAIEAIVSDPSLKVDGLILPGHVSTIIGERPYFFLAEKYNMPGVIAGFEAVDILQALLMLLTQIAHGEARIEIAYTRGVDESGNLSAVSAIDRVFETCVAKWRGLGEIGGSGYRLREEFKCFDAIEKLHPDIEETKENRGCRCGDVLRGIITPKDCPLFRSVCNPENPIGPCMVSSEGTCAAYYRYY